MCIDDYMFFAIIISPQAKENPYKVSQILNKMDYNLVAVQMLAMGFPPKNNNNTMSIFVQTSNLKGQRCQIMYKKDKMADNVK